MLVEMAKGGIEDPWLHRGKASLALGFLVIDHLIGSVERGATYPRNLTCCFKYLIRREKALSSKVKYSHNWGAEKAVVACGENGMVVWNQGGRTMDCGDGGIDPLLGISELLNTNKGTRKKIFFGSGIHEGTVAIESLALSALGCLTGRPHLCALWVDRKDGTETVSRILEKELCTASVAGIRDLANVDATANLEA